MHASRLLISTLTAAGIFGLVGASFAQSTTTTTPGATITTTPGTTTTVTPPTFSSTNETASQRMDRERMDRERMDRERTERATTERERMNAPAGSGSTNQWTTDSRTGSTERRDANGNLSARADRN